MVLQTGNLIIAIHVLPNISKGKGNQTNFSVNITCPIFQ